MKRNIETTYEITKDTIALLPAANMNYCTIVFERNETLYIQQTPLEIIKSACLEGGSTYEGRRTAVTHQTGKQNKVPIPIDPLKGIYAFPTHSPKQFECTWLFYHHIKSIKENKTDSKQSIVVLKNYQEIALNITFGILENQFLRTSHCVMRFSFLV